MTAAEETMWLALYTDSPWGDERADLRSAQIAQILYNTNAKKGSGKELSAFMLFHRKTKKAQEDVTYKVREWFGKVKDKL